MGGPEAQVLYEAFVEELRSRYSGEKVVIGSLGAYMQVELCNDGPVTVELNAETQPTKTSDQKSCERSQVGKRDPAAPSSASAIERLDCTAGDISSNVARSAKSRRTATHPSHRTRVFSLRPSQVFGIGAMAAASRQTIKQ